MADSMSHSGCWGGNSVRNIALACCAGGPGLTPVVGKSPKWRAANFRCFYPAGVFGGMEKLEPGKMKWRCSKFPEGREKEHQPLGLLR